MLFKTLINWPQIRYLWVGLYYYYLQCFSKEHGSFIIKFVSCKEEYHSVVAAHVMNTNLAVQK